MTTNDRHDKNPSPSDEVLAPQSGETSTPPLHDNDGPSADARSGTGQRTPHHGLAYTDAQDADDASAGSGTGSSYRSGGTRQDRVPQEEERKQREGAAGVANSLQGGADPAPGAPATRDGS
jgi:hypothetical protein